MNVPVSISTSDPCHNGNDIEESIHGINYAEIGGELRSFAEHDECLRNPLRPWRPSFCWSMAETCQYHDMQL